MIPIALAAQVDAEQLTKAGSGALGLADDLIAMRRTAGRLDHTASADLGWETAAALRLCADSARDRMEVQAEDVGGFGEKLKHAGDGYRAVDEAGERLLRAIETKLTAHR